VAFHEVIFGISEGMVRGLTVAMNPRREKLKSSSLLFHAGVLFASRFAAIVKSVASFRISVGAAAHAMMIQHAATRRRTTLCGFMNIHGMVFFVICISE
jgi:hypothetical protein